MKQLLQKGRRFPLVINIYSKGVYPADQLSNFYPHPFVFDGICVSCMEALLQSMKFADPEQQKQICTMSAKEAKSLGSTQNWQRSGQLYWQGKRYDRYSVQYQQLLDRAYDALLTNVAFQQALLDSGHAILIHSIGKYFRRNTCLTAGEFCRLLLRKRKQLREKTVCR